MGVLLWGALGGGLGAEEKAWGAEVFLESRTGEVEPVPVAVEVSGATLLRTQVAEILQTDLEWSFLFRTTFWESTGMEMGEILPASLLERAGRQQLDAVVRVQVQVEEDRVLLLGQIYETATGMRIFARRYVGSRDLLRRVVHRFSDDVVFQLTGEPGIAQTRIAFVSDRSGSKEIYLMDYDGYNLRRITWNRSINLSPAWSPDGRILAYTSYYPNGKPKIYAVDLLTRRRWLVADMGEMSVTPTWSPRGGELIIAASLQGGSHLYRISSEGGILGQLTFGLGAQVSPSWSPSGEEVVFTSDRSGSPQLYLLRVDGTNLRRLTFEGSYNTDPQWSPRGDWIAYTCRRGGAFRICLIRPDGTDLRVITQGPGEDEDPSWAPDGRHLVFASNRKGTWDLYMTNLKGTFVVRLTHNGANNTSPAWSPRVGSRGGS